MNAPIVVPALVLSSSAFLLACSIVLTERILRRKQKPDDLIDLINEQLPQTQCAQCGYPGCLPYAKAVAQGENISLCKPGGATTQSALSLLLNRPIEHAYQSDPHPPIARIREADCIGCGLCAAACPVDAIVGAVNYLHSILEVHCTGCELCLPPCPVDCIELIELTNVSGSSTDAVRQTLVR
ncbi:MAG: RnfABCDGE type electron transport complex subunit B [Gammaproteobacteria bacterium]|nr:RnfABCDGE type electron transport complex subunit B [Gammaproteobacteria bacterium]MYF38095.1 RnfABCDGE type electron transport complex subunit B [Gammaproteobacteria bacterium]